MAVYIRPCFHRRRRRRRRFRRRHRHRFRLRRRFIFVFAMVHVPFVLFYFFAIFATEVARAGKERTNAVLW